MGSSGINSRAKWWEPKKNASQIEKIPPKELMAKCIGELDRRCRRTFTGCELSSLVSTTEELYGWLDVDYADLSSSSNRRRRLFTSQGVTRRLLEAERALSMPEGSELRKSRSQT